MAGTNTGRGIWVISEVSVAVQAALYYTAKMELQVVQLEKVILAGISFYGDPFRGSAAWTEENEIGRLWKRFGTYCKEKKEEIPPSIDRDKGYELHIWDEHTMETGFYEVFIGYPVETVSRIPVFM